MGDDERSVAADRRAGDPFARGDRAVLYVLAVVGLLACAASAAVVVLLVRTTATAGP
jgi:hypothetical protein